MIYYSHVNEDSKPEHTTMSSHAFSNVIVVAGSGERVISLMNHPSIKSLNIIDPNLEALYLTELKITALQILTVPEYLVFIGFDSNHKNHEYRETLLKLVFKKLSKNCASYWQENKEIIVSGKLLIFGHFETFINRVSTLLRVVFFSKIDSMMVRPYAVWGAYERVLWKFIKQIFAFKLSYKLFGIRDSAFIDKDSNTSIIAESFQKSFDENKQSSSFFVHLLFYGNLKKMSIETLPNSLSEPFLSEVKMNLNNKPMSIEYYQTDLRTYLEGEKVYKNTYISASDILSFELPNYMDSILTALTDNVYDSSNQIVWRSFLKRRDHYTCDKNQLNQNIFNISHFDKTNMYRVYTLKF